MRNRKLNVLALLVLLCGSVWGQDKKIALSTTDNFNYDGEELHHYGVGFHKYLDELDGYNLYGSGYFGIDLFTAGKNRLRISKNGYIGIGTNDPKYKLDVSGHARASRFYLNAGGGIYSLHNSSYILNDHANGNITINAAGGSLYLGYINTNKVLLRKGLYDISGSHSIINENGYIYQSKSGVNNYFNGNVGIGTSSPKADLEILNSTSVAGNSSGFHKRKCFF